MISTSKIFPHSTLRPFTLRRGSICLGLAAMLLASSVAPAATTLKAPVKMLAKGHNRVAVLAAVDKLDGSKIVFENRLTLFGQPEARPTVRLDKAIYDQVRKGETYVVVFSNVVRDFRLRELRQLDPEGYRVVTILGGGAALLDDNPEVRMLFAAATAADPPAPATLLQAALVAADSKDARTRAFGVLELALRPEWFELLSSADVTRLRGFLEDPAFAPDLRDRLFELVRQLPATQRDPWLVKEARRTLGGIDPEFDLTTFFPRLAETALAILGSAGGKDDVALVANFLSANNPGVVEAALEAIDNLDPAIARKRAAAVLETSDLHAESRRLLTEYLG